MRSARQGPEGPFHPVVTPQERRPRRCRRPPSGHPLWLAVQTITITAPSGGVSVQYKVYDGGGLGGLCDPKSSGTLATVSRAAVPGFPAASLVDVTMTNSTPGSADALYRSELIPTAAADALKVGDSACAETSYTNIVKLDASRGLELYYTEIIVNGVQTLNDVEAAQATSEYQQARQILLSTTH